MNGERLVAPQRTVRRQGAALLAVLVSAAVHMAALAAVVMWWQGDVSAPVGDVQVELVVVADAQHGDAAGPPAKQETAHDEAIEPLAPQQVPPSPAPMPKVASAPIAAPTPPTEAATPKPVSNSSESAHVPVPAEVRPAAKSPQTRPRQATPSTQAVRAQAQPAPAAPAHATSPAAEESRIAPSTSAAGGTSMASVGALPAAVTAVRNPAPDYPVVARRRGEEGRVVLLVDVDPDGNPASVTVATGSGHAALDDAAVRAVRRWRFANPERRQTEVKVPVQFRLRAADRGN